MPAMDSGVLTYRARPVTLGSGPAVKPELCKSQWRIVECGHETHCVGPRPTVLNALYCFLYLKLELCYVNDIFARYLSFCCCDKLLL